MKTKEPTGPKAGLWKIISGGQTGVDRAALDVALKVGLNLGGWCPLGRRAEDGPIPPHYPLQETATAEYPERTEANIQQGDGTLILTRGKPDKGTGLTLRLARKLRKPHLVADPSTLEGVPGAVFWLQTRCIGVLNVAGPRASSDPEIYELACEFLLKMIAQCQGPPGEGEAHAPGK